jgi:RNA 2',3'-cyclic 3'-phosphodiesterase
VSLIDHRHFLKEVQMPRLFTGLEIPARLITRLSMMRGKLAGARWIDPENFHITLRFAGDIDDLQAHAFAACLEDIEFDSFDIQVEGLGSFGGNKPRALFAGVRMTEPLERLQKAHERAARRAGLPPEARNFTPHVTLARLKDSKPAAVAEYLSYYGALFAEPFRVSRFVLFSSRASKGGGPYIIEECYPFRGARGREAGAML